MQIDRLHERANMQLADVLKGRLDMQARQADVSEERLRADLKDARKTLKLVEKITTLLEYGTNDTCVTCNQAKAILAAERLKDKR